MDSAGNNSHNLSTGDVFGEHGRGSRLDPGSGCQQPHPSCLAASGQFGLRTEGLWKPSGSRKQAKMRPRKGALGMCAAWTSPAKEEGTPGATTASETEVGAGGEPRSGSSAGAGPAHSARHCLLHAFLPCCKNSRGQSEPHSVL